MTRIRPLNPIAKRVELRIFSHFCVIMSAEPRGLNVQITVHIRPGSTRVEEWQGQGEEFSCILKTYICGNLHSLGKSKYGWQTQKEADCLSLLHSTTPRRCQRTCCKPQAASAAQTSCLLPCQGFLSFDSFNHHGNEVSTLWLSFHSKFLKYFIIYKRFPYWLRTGKIMNVQNLRVLIIKISIVVALVKQRLFLKNFWRKICKRHSFILFIFIGVSFCVWRYK